MQCRTAGEMFSVSLAQGGPAPCFFRKWCYQFLATGDFDAMELTKDDVDDLEYASLIERVSTSAEYVKNCIFLSYRIVLTFL